VRHNFKHESKLAGKNWAEGFLRRNRELRVRKPEPTTVITILAFKKIEVARIYDNVVTFFENNKFGLNNTFSVAESGFLCVKKPAPDIQLSKTD
jgi:hypothetical protein